MLPCVCGRLLEVPQYNDRGKLSHALARMEMFEDWSVAQITNKIKNMKARGGASKSSRAVDHGDDQDDDDDEHEAHNEDGDDDDEEHTTTNTATTTARGSQRARRRQ